jgi:hypothetical protein
LSRGEASYRIYFKDVRQRKKAATGLPTTVYEAYKRLPDRDDVNKDFALRILSWIHHAKRPLTVGEISHAQAVTRGSKDLTPDDINDHETIAKSCQGLVITSRFDGSVRFLHQSTVEAFLRERHGNEILTPHEIASVCLTYLAFDEFKDGPCYRTHEFRVRVAVYCFSRYCADYWLLHVREARGSSEVLEQALETFDSLSTIEAIEQIQLAFDNPIIYDKPFTSILHFWIENTLVVEQPFPIEATYKLSQFLS